MKEYSEVELSEFVHNYSPVHSGEVYVYSMKYGEFNITKKLMSDFNNWVVTVACDQDNTIVISGSPPEENVSDYTLLHHIENFVKQDLSAEPDPIVVLDTPEE